MPWANEENIQIKFWGLDGDVNDKSDWINFFYPASSSPANLYSCNLSIYYLRGSCQISINDVHPCCIGETDTTGKYIKEGAEISSSEETVNEELQSKLWELSARYVRLDGYEPLECVPPPAEEEQTKKKEEKPKKKTKKDKTEDENGEEKVAVPEDQADEDKGKEIETNGHHDATEENGKEELNGKNDENGTEHTNGTEHANGTSHINGTEHTNGKEEAAEEPTTITEKCKVVEQAIESQPEDDTPVVENQAVPVENEEAADR